MARDGEEDPGLLADWNVSGLDVVEGEFVATTADGTGAPVDDPLARLPDRIRRTLGVDLVFGSAPIIGRDGSVCCFNHATPRLREATSHHKVLKAVAQLISSVVPPPARQGEAAE